VARAERGAGANGMTSSIAIRILSGMASNTQEKVRENRLRRMAERQGLRLVKSRRRDRRAIDYGLYTLVSDRTNTVVAGTERTTGRPEFTLDDVEAWLTGEAE
jgi:hypothetical protein